MRDPVTTALGLVPMVVEQTNRGERAYDEARSRYAWPALARGLAHVYDEVREGRPAAAGAHTLLEA